MGLGVFEAGDDEPLHPFSCVHVFVDRDLVGRPPFELAAHAHVDPLGVLAEDDEVDVLRGAPFERDEAIVERLHRADVGVEVEAEAHAEEDVARVLEAGDARIAEGAEEDGARFVLHAVGDLLRVGGAVFEVAVGAEVELPQVEAQAALVAVELEDARSLGDDLGADAVAGKNREEGHGRGDYAATRGEGYGVIVSGASMTRGRETAGSPGIASVHGSVTWSE